MIIYCTECAIDGKGVEEARYILRGQSLCYHHFWALAGAGDPEDR